MFDRLWSIARNTFLETIRQPIYGVLLIATMLALILNIFLAAFTLSDDDKLLMDLGLSTMLLSGLFLSAFSAAGILAREIENKTVLTIISKPVSRPIFLIGKYLGLVGAQLLAFHISFLVFVLAMHHRVLQMSADPWDWPAILLGGGAILIAILAAGAVNYFYGREFVSTAMLIGVPLLTVGTLATACFDREWGPAPFGHSFADGQLLIAAFLVLLAILILAAVALAASTRLSQIMTLMVCTVVLGAGFVTDWLCQDRDKSIVAAIAYGLIPNVNVFWAGDALTAEIDIPLKYLTLSTAYAGFIVISVLSVAVALFQRREVG
ncbi:MAG: ABC transporter permease [Phycisphaerales bacterium]|nr:ABC transporter permease [Phycisphaerales bacterium]